MNKPKKPIIPMSDRVNELPSKEWLEELFEYRPEEGLFWKLRPLDHFKCEVDWYIWNKRFATKCAGNKAMKKRKHKRESFRDHSRVQLPLCKRGTLKSFAVHRIAFVLMGVELPYGTVVDHINGDAWDNRWINLRIATYQQNMHNKKGWGDRRKHKLPKGVYLGVEGRPCPFYSMIKVNGKYECLGYFHTIEMAREAYCKRAIEVHGAFVNLG